MTFHFLLQLILKSQKNITTSEKGGVAPVSKHHVKKIMYVASSYFTHSRPHHYVEMNSEFTAPNAHTRGNRPQVTLYRKSCRLLSHSERGDNEKSYYPC
jgi:hypothetical protein